MFTSRNPDLILLHAPSVYDFRRESILYGPVSDLVPSTPVFEMYPVGFTTIAEYLERHGLETRIVNLAFRMLDEPGFDAEKAISRLHPAVFGIDLHWLPHAHGSVEVAKIAKRLHPDIPVMFGGFSATYFHQELILYPAVDFVFRGDSTEAPIYELVQYIRSGATHPAAGSPDAERLARIPNLVWKDAAGAVTVNPLTHVVENLDDQLLDYSYVIKAVARYRDLANFIPFQSWKRYPIMAAIPLHGCTYNCVTCGGSACTFKNVHNRQKPAFRKPEDLANDVRKMGSFSNGPVVVIGDIRMGGEDYAERFLTALSGYKKSVFFELFDAAPPEYFQRIRRALPNFTIEISMESADEDVRLQFGRPYTNAAIEETIRGALEAGCQRLDLFFMTGLKGQTTESVLGTVDYCRRLLEKYCSGSDKRIVPFISPMGPFLDPGSRAFEEPEKHGYKLFARTLEEHRQALLAPSWKYVLNYETQWMTRDQIVAATYEAARGMNALKAEFGIIDEKTAQTTAAHIEQSVCLMKEIDQVMEIADPDERHHRLIELKRRIDRSSLSTVCDKKELEISLKGPNINYFQAALVVAKGWLQSLGLM